MCRAITTSSLTKKALNQVPALCTYHLQTVLQGTSQLTPTFASFRDQLQVPLGHLLPADQLTWREVEKSCHRMAGAHTNCYQWGCILIVIQTCIVKRTIFGFMLVSQGLELVLIKDREGDYAASQWDLYAECHFVLWEPAKNSVSEGMYNCQNQADEWWYHWIWMQNEGQVQNSLAVGYSHNLSRMGPGLL